jgi:hypothetical protein
MWINIYNTVILILQAMWINFIKNNKNVSIHKCRIIIKNKNNKFCS